MSESGEIKFYHGDKIGSSIQFTLQEGVSREEFLRRACSDPEVEGFEVAWNLSNVEYEGGQPAPERK